MKNATNISGSYLRKTFQQCLSRRDWNSAVVVLHFLSSDVVFASSHDSSIA